MRFGLDFAIDRLPPELDSSQSYTRGRTRATLTLEVPKL